MLNICSHGAGNAFCGHNSKALIDGTKYTSFGGYTRKTNAISSPKSYLKQNPHGRRPLTSEMASLTTRPVLCTMGCQRAVTTIAWHVLLRKQYGFKFSLGSTLTPQQIGGRTNYYRCPKNASERSTTQLSTPCGTYERSATTGSSTQLMPRSPSCWKDQGKSRPK